MLELALWRKKINEERHSTTQNLGTKRRNKKMKQDKSSLREQCRINCGADIVIERGCHILKIDINFQLIQSSCFSKF